MRLYQGWSKLSHDFFLIIQFFMARRMAGSRHGCSRWGRARIRARRAGCHVFFLVVFAHAIGPASLGVDNDVGLVEHGA